MKEASSNSDNRIRKSVLKSASSQKIGASPARNTSQTSNLKFSSNINVREYDKHDTASSVGSILEAPSAYEPANFTTAPSGKIIQYCHPDEDVDLTKHRDDMNRRSSSKSQVNTSDSDDDKHQVNVVEIWFNDHIQGEVVSKQVFSVQECMIWFSIDNWATFQESTAFELPNSDHTESGRRYKFDFIVPKMNESLLIDDNEQQVYDIFGQPLTIQFHVIIRSGKLIYLDNEFKVYSLKLKHQEPNTTEHRKIATASHIYDPDFMEIELNPASSDTNTMKSISTSQSTEAEKPKHETMVSQLKQSIKKLINPNKERS